MNGHQSPVYDRIGGGYVAGRREDPRIARSIWEGLGDARAVVNVGAGTGSYEPTDRRVVAVEPSAVMLAQRPGRAAPAVKASAESLPFTDDEFDAAMAVLSVHHWTDKRKGLAEMRRVARGPVVVFGRVADASPCVDGFEAAYWQRPGAILDPEVWQAMSALALIPEPDRADGMRRLHADLESGEWEQRWSGLLEVDELNLGYRVLVGAGQTAPRGKRRLPPGCRPLGTFQRSVAVQLAPT